MADPQSWSSRQQHTRISFDLEIPDVENFVKLILQQQKTPEDIEAIQHTLQKKLRIPYFIGLSQRLPVQDYHYFLSQLALHHRSKGTVIIEKRKKNDYFYIILRGQVNILDEAIRPGKTINDRRTDSYEVINTLAFGDTFGQATLLNPKALTTACVVGKTEVLLLVANHEAFSRTLSDSSQFLKFEDKLNYFLNHPLFQGIAQTSIRDIIPQVRAIKYSLYQEVYRCGDLHEEMYFILQGEVMLKSGVAKGAGIVKLGAGEYFGIQSPDLRNVSVLRCQTAISQSTQLIVYRILFKRLSVMQHGFEIFLDNMRLNLQKKIEVHQQLCRNQEILEKFRQKKKCSVPTKQTKSPIQTTKKKKKATRGPKPSLEWWGVASDETPINKYHAHQSSEIKNSNRNSLHRNHSIGQHHLKPPLVDQAVRKPFLEAFTENCRQIVNGTATPSLKYSLVNNSHSAQNQQHIKAYPLIKAFKSSFSQKSLKKDDYEEDDDSTKKKKLACMLPKIHKRILLNYAKDSSPILRELLNIDSSQHPQQTLIPPVNRS